MSWREGGERGKKEEDEGRGKRANNRVVTGRQQMKAGEEWAGVGAAGRGASEQASLLASEVPVGWRWLGG